jgi:YHS domain-containing protein
MDAHCKRPAVPLLCAALLSLPLAACVATPGRIKQTKSVPALDAPGAIAIEGYDAVAYFENGKPELGDASHHFRWQGAEWYFSSSVHRDAFAATPEQYAPQYGSYCAFAVSRGSTAHGDPKLWAIVNNKLYLNNNHFAMELWDQDRPGNIVAGDQNWPLLPKSPVP